MVRLTKDLEEHIEGRHVVFVEDVVDTGLTSSYILKNLRAREPASLRTCVLFDRPRRRLIEFDIAYKGFELPDLFVVGYGLDYQQKYRNLRTSPRSRPKHCSNLHNLLRKTPEQSTEKKSPSLAGWSTCLLSQQSKKGAN